MANVLNSWLIVRFDGNNIFSWETQVPVSSKCLIFNISITFSRAMIRSWKYNIRRNVNSGLSIVTRRKVAIIVFELGVIKNFMQKL